MTNFKQEPEAISVNELTIAIKALLEDNFDYILVEGEISNYKAHSSGHKYFTLKDDRAQIACTMWKSRQLNFIPKDGDKVIIVGKVDVYPPQGKYQIDCFEIRAKGVGDLYIAYEQLKRKLEEKGYFLAENKKLLRPIPQRIGVATSATGAAVRDVFSTLARRMSSATVYFRPTIVQGDEAAPDIVNAINELSNTDCDVIIVGRGGGSIEDLWAFNTEVVAEAIYNSDKVIISAVGHETDFTIADFVADYRAATPTAAAELSTPKPSDDLKFGLQRVEERLYRFMVQNIEQHKKNITNIVEKASRRRIEDKIKVLNQFCDDSDSRAEFIIKNKFQALSQKVAALQRITENLNPKIPLEKGYAILENKGKPLGRNESLVDYKLIEIIRLNETAQVQVKKVLPPRIL